MFQVTFSLGQYPMDWIDTGVSALGEWLSSTMPDGPLKAMLVDGIIGGVGAVIVFLPQILILYAFISFMEDSGYMARAAFIMDKLMHKMGLHGKSFIPSGTFTLEATTTICLVIMNPKTTDYATAQNILIDDASLTTSDGGIE